MLHTEGDCRERLRLRRYALLMMQRLWTGILSPYLDSLPPNTLKRKLIERDFDLLMGMLEHDDDHGCGC